jgi:glycosyltransferase involved in cell wall biosynthesis
MKILIVSAYAPPHRGGIEFVVWEQARRFARKGHEVTWVSSRFADEAPREDHEGYTLLRAKALNPFESRGIPYPIFTTEFKRIISDQVDRSQIVHVHGMLYQGTSLAIREARERGRPVVLTSHVIDQTRPPGGDGIGWVKRMMNRSVKLMEWGAHRFVGHRNVRNSDAIVVLNSAVHDYVRRVPGSDSNIHWIPNGVDTYLFSPVSGEEKIFIRKRLGLPVGKKVATFVGRLVPRKGPQLVVQAVRPDMGIHVVVVGNGSIPCREQVPAPHVTIWPAQPREKIPDILRASDVLVLPSIGEGFPLIAQEAMACAVPVILSNDPSYKDYVDSSCAKLVSPTVEGVREGLSEMLGSKQNLERAGRSARKLAEKKFAWDSNVEKHLDLYASLVSKNQNRVMRKETQCQVQGID